MILIKTRFIKVTYNKSGSPLGRCGGGWLYKFGIMGGKSSFVAEFTFVTIRIDFKGKLK